MMKIEIIVIFVGLIIFSCSLENKNTKSDKNLTKNVFIDTKIDVKENDTIELITFKELDSIFPIFTISPKSYGILIELKFNDDNELNLLYNNIGEVLLNLALEKHTDTNKLKLIDSIGYQKLYYNPLISKKLKRYLDKEFQIYCINGSVKSKVKDIVFHTSDCLTNYVLLRLEQIDKKLGQPIFAAQKNFELEYGEYNKVSKIYNSQEDKINKDYPDNKHITFFAKNNNYYFGYNDDFERYKRKKGNYYLNLKVYFPYRKIIEYKNDSIKTIYNQEIDIYGVPCD